LEAGGDGVGFGKGRHVDLLLASHRQIDANPGPTVFRASVPALAAAFGLAAGRLLFGSDEMDLDRRDADVHRCDAFDRHHVEGRRAKPGGGARSSRRRPAQRHQDVSGALGPCTTAAAEKSKSHRSSETYQTQSHSGIHCTLRFFMLRGSVASL
jgi:hypothetical protein